MAEAGQTQQCINSILECTVFVENLRTSIEKLAKILKPLYAEKYGEKAIVALIRKRDGYEVTFASKEIALHCVDNGFKIENRHYDAVSMFNSDILVNMVPVPAYVDDDVLAKKLQDIGCTFVGEVKRSQVEGIETGRRKVIVRLPANMRSLPRAMNIKTAEGRDERIDLYHRNQRIRKMTR